MSNFRYVIKPKATGTKVISAATVAAVPGLSEFLGQRAAIDTITNPIARVVSKYPIVTELPPLDNYVPPAPEEEE